VSWQMEENNKNLIFQKINELKELTINQKKSLMAGDIDIYISIERFRNDLRKEIDKIKSKTTFNMQEYREFQLLINEMIELENDNKRLLSDWSENLKLEKNKVRKFGKISSIYFNKNRVPSRSRYINKIT
jgi:hypothetical protein